MRRLLLLLCLTGAMFAAVEYFDECMSIDAPGTYKLESNLEYTGSSSCIRIMANSVTLDCRNHSLTGSYDATGILINEGVRDVRVRDCWVRYFRNGIYAEEGASDLHLEGPTIDSCDEGISLSGGRDADITEPYITNTNVGVRLNNWLRGETSGGYFSTRDYGIHATSLTSYNIAANTFTNSEVGLYTEGLCTGTAVSGNIFYGMGTPIEIYGSSASFTDNTFHGNSGYAILIREGLNTFDGVHIYGQDLFFATQSKAFSITGLMIGEEEGVPGTALFGEFASPKPFTTTKYYYFNNTNVIVGRDVVSVSPPDYSSIKARNVSVWQKDPEIEGDLAVFNAAGLHTSRSSVLSSGVALEEPVPETSSPEVLEFTLDYFLGSYAVGERPPEPEAPRMVSEILLDSPSFAQANSTISIEAEGQDGLPLAGAEIYYYENATDMFLAGYTGLQGMLDFSIPDEGVFVIEARYENVSAQRAISVSAPVVEEEPPAEADNETGAAPEPEEIVDMEEYTPQSPDYGLAAVGGAFLIAIIVAGIWYFFLREPPKSHSPRELARERLKKFAKEREKK